MRPQIKPVPTGLKVATMGAMAYPPQIAIRPISRPFDKRIRLPGSKSLTNRALIAAALSNGVSTLASPLIAEDTELMIAALRSLGVAIACDDQVRLATIRGCGGAWPHEEASLYCGNAGTVVRFLTAACAAASGKYRLDGDPRMRERPIKPLVDALTDLGATIGYEGETGFCPLTVAAHGLRGGQVAFDRPISSQFVSALLLASPRAANDVMIRVTGELSSAPYVTMTLDVMRAFGVEAVQDRLQSFVVPAPQTYTATAYQIEPDASAASYFFAAAALTGSTVRIAGFGAGSTQGDLGFVRLLERMGCVIEQGEYETTVTGPADGRLKAIDADLRDMPDVVPTLAVLAAFAQGDTTMRNVGSLRFKETDRLEALSTELAKMGVQVEVSQDDLRVLPSERPRGAEINTYRDHRLAMSFALAGLVLEGMVINDPGCVQKTFPEFFQIWETLGE